MALTPDDVVTKQFQHVGFKEGFDPDEVDDFLDEIVVEWRKTIAENDELKAKLAAYESGESAPAPAPVAAPVAAPAPADGAESQGAGPVATAGIIELAQRLHDEHVAEGLAQRDKLVADAKAQAASIVVRGRDARSRRGRQARSRARRTRDPHHRAAQFERDYRAQLRSYIEGKLRDLETTATTSGVDAGLGHRPLGRPLTGRPPLRPSAAGTIIAVLALLVLAADQFTKYLALENLPPEEPVHVIGDFLIFYLDPQPRRRVLARRGRHVDLHDRAGRRRGDHRLARRDARPLAAVGGGARAAARRRARQPHRPRAAASPASRSGTSSTSSTRPG